MLHRLLVVALILVAAVPEAEARRRRKNTKQSYELRVDLDIGIATEANASLFDVQLSWFMDTPLQHGDVVAPQLRRHVRNPNELYVRATREGSTLDTRTGIYLGGTANLGPAYARGQLGLEHDDVRYDPVEGSYIATPIDLEAGVRPSSAIAIGALGRFRPTIDSSMGEMTGFQSEREGHELEAGGIISASTPNDSLFASLSVAYHRADWEFNGSILGGGTDVGGPMTASGLRGALRVSVQPRNDFSWIIRVVGSREYWDNNRANQDIIDFDPPYERWVYSVHAEAGFVYWHDKRMGFRVSAGGGYDSTRPHYGGQERATIHFGLGVNYRF